MKTIKNISAKVEITDLEQLGWDFSNIYSEVSEAKSISIEEAADFEKQNYCVRLIVDEKSNVSYSICQKAHYGNEEFYQGDSGDNAAALEDLRKLINSNLVWDVK
jgi:hypothetical protein